MLIYIDIKIENNNFTTGTDCMLLLQFIFKHIIYSVFTCSEKIWLCDNQPLIVKLPKTTQKQRRCENLNNSIYSDNSVG